MESSTDLILLLAAILLGAKLAARASQRFGIPGVFGELLLGVALGPAVLGLVAPEETLSQLADIGVILLMFVVGLETDLVEMRSVGRAAFAAAVGGVVLPLIGGIALGNLFGLGLGESLFLGAVLTATSVSISAATLRELGRLRSREGTAILGAAIIDDVIGIIVLAVVSAMSTGGDPLAGLVRMVVFLPLAIVLGQRGVPRLMARIQRHFPAEAHLALVVALALAYAWMAKSWGGLAAITGSYLAGVLVAQSDSGEEIARGLSNVGYAFFTPIFFVAVGLNVDISQLSGSPWLVLAIIGIAVGGKIVGCYLGAWAGRLSALESLRVGVGMVSRGEVALVIATTGLRAGIIGSSIFALAVFMTLVTTLITPLLLKLTYLREAKESSPAELVRVVE